MLTQSKQRHTKDFLCPVCDYYDDPRGRGNGTRCNGATWETTEGQVYSICSRQESPRPSESDGWIHWVNGPCDCGISHGEDKQKVVRGRSANEGDYVSSPVEMTHIREHLPPLEKAGEPYAMTILKYSGIEYKHMRQDYVDLETGKRTKKIWWDPNPSKAVHSPKDFPLHQPAGQVIQSQDDVVVIVEGQKAANAVWAAGFKVLGLYGTGTKPTDSALLQYLKETARILIWPDADQSGRECMTEIWGRLNTLLPDARLSWVEVPEAEDKDDAADCSTERVKELINQIIDKPQSEEKYGLQPKEFADTFPADVPDWAFFGALGKITFAMDPFTEADKHALFMQMLTAAGALTGISPHVANAVGHPQLYTTLVGKTGARKGTSWRNVETYFLRPLMNSLGMSREQQMEFIVRGVSSGEGMVALFNPPDKPADDHDAEFDPDAEPEEPEGSIQKLMILEEFRELLTSTKRKDSKTSSIFRLLYDNVDINIPTRTAPLTARDPHLTCIGHITKSELADEFPQEWAMYGVLNRILLVPVKRTKRVPIEQTEIPSGLLDEQLSVLRYCVAEARRHTEIRFTEDGSKMFNSICDWWDAIADEEGNEFIAAACGRFTDHVGKIALILALLDPDSYVDSPTGLVPPKKLVDAPHVAAAKEWAVRSVEAVKWIWRQDNLTQQETDVIHFLEFECDSHTAGRQEVREALHNNPKLGAFEALAESLVAKGWIEVYEEKKPKVRRKEVWKLIRFT